MLADRLLLQRLRKSQSGTALYGDSQPAQPPPPIIPAEDVAEPSVYAAYEGVASQRLIVVANRLPVSAFKDKDGAWQLQASSPCQTCKTCLSCTHAIGGRSSHRHALAHTSCVPCCYMAATPTPSGQGAFLSAFMSHASRCIAGQCGWTGERFDGSRELQVRVDWLARSACPV